MAELEFELVVVEVVAKRSAETVEEVESDPLAEASAIEVVAEFVPVVWALLVVVKASV